MYFISFRWLRFLQFSERGELLTRKSTKTFFVSFNTSIIFINNDRKFYNCFILSIEKNLKCQK